MGFTVPYIASVKRNAAVVASYLFVLLFLYAAVSKLLDFETFTVQLAQSPLLSAYAGFIAWAVPGLEILIAVLLTLQKYRIPALYAAFTLMVMFTAYIYIILNFSDFIPCSCGGVLEKLSWTQHLIFNIVFIILAGVAVLVSSWYSSKKTLFLLAALAIFGVATVALLFAFSEKKMHRNNAFQRRYPHHPANEVARLDIGYNSYYIAGITKDSVYLGNTTAPLHVLAINKKLKEPIQRTIKIPNTTLPFRAFKVVIEDTLLYIMDGSVPLILKGETQKLTGTKSFQLTQEFLRAEPMGKDDFVVRGFDPVTTANVLGKLRVGDSMMSTHYPKLLTAYDDPFFDTDGLLLYNQQLKKVIYVYFYRNEFVVANNDFSLDYLGKTIDTISRPQLDVRTIASKNERKMGKNPIFVNLLASTYGEYLFIQSDRLGKYESEETIKSAAIIDVYSLTDQSYLFSFYLYHSGLKKLHEFKVDGKNLYAIIDTYLIHYQLKDEDFKTYTKN
ncbi:MauE/DoxX family redox-associated membrane protein [Bizionia paragorgiae]|uniref:MauE/DoxX family redox-associated membrane protein n=1 Tax=Bizionia paragorgiae TaxID=283786 RepID=UPI003A953B95